ncbi:MAG TPA: Type 1 glutamine amidotransferase-like domain-containing protein [Ktedonobacterales bacterium]|nr:Type 1 glutamine amidotransferase-like domain-containing protein [Ktedonobacterales bacterium]
MTTSPTGTLALVGSGEFLPAIEPLDRLLLERLSAPARVVVLPTASAPDGPGVPERWAKMGVEHFSRLNAAVEPIMLLTRADAESEAMAEQIAAANFVYFSGGKPQYLVDVLRDTPCWRAIVGVFAAGGVVAGCSAGAMAMADRMVDFPRLWRTIPALGLASGIAVIPHFDEFPGVFTNLGRLASGQTRVVGVPGSTGLIGSDLGWTAQGRSPITVFTSKGKKTYAPGEQVPLAD